MLDSLISLPLLSFFALPMLSSYTTSLNLLFFYMTWTTLVMSHSSLQVEFFGTLIIRVLFFLVPSLISLLFDTGLPSVAVSIKAQGDVAMPRRYGKRRLMSIVQWSLLNIVAEVALIAGIDVLLTRVLQFSSVLNIAIRLPLPWKIATDLLKGFVVRGVSLNFTSSSNKRPANSVYFRYFNFTSTSTFYTARETSSRTATDPGTTASHPRSP